MPGRPIPRLYYTTVLRRPDGTLVSFPAVLAPGQRVDRGSHTPSFTALTSIDPPPPPTK